MAMTTCPQCDGDMSNYALSCPHCGKMNPAAPQAILLQEKREKHATPGPVGRDPIPKIETAQPSPEQKPSNKSDLVGIGRWVAELRNEWSALTPSKKTAAQMLFGSAVMVGMGLFVYAMIGS